MINSFATELRIRICGRSAVTWATLIVVTPIALMSNVGRLELTPSQRLSLSLVGLFASILLIGTARSVLRLRSPSTISPLWLILGIYALLGLGRAAVPHIAAALGLTPTQPWSTGAAIQGVCTAIVLFSMIAYAVEGLREQGDIVARLASQSTQLEQFRATADDQLRQTREAVLAATNVRIRPAIAHVLVGIREAIDQSLPAKHLHEVADLLRTDLQTAVQLLGRNLTTAPAQQHAAASTDNSDPPRLTYSDVIRSWTTGDPFVPWLNAAILGLLYLPISFQSAGATGALLAVGLGLAVYLILVISQQLMRHQTRLRFTGWLAAVLLTGAIAGAFNAFTLQHHGITATQALLNTIALQLWCSAVIATAKAAQMQLHRTTRALEVANTEYRHATDGMQRAQSAIRRRVGSMLHGDIQGRLVANALRLDLAADQTDKDERRRAAQDTLRDIEKLELQLETITTPVEDSVTLDESLNRIADQWQGLVEVRVNLRPHTANLAQATRIAITEIVREGVNNAAEHGGASIVTVDVNIGTEHVDISVKDNGRKQATLPSDSLASLDRNPDAFPVTNEIRRATGTTQLHVVIPIT